MGSDSDGAASGRAFGGCPLVRGQPSLLAPDAWAGHRALPEGSAPASEPPRRSVAALARHPLPASAGAGQDRTPRQARPDQARPRRGSTARGAAWRPRRSRPGAEELAHPPAGASGASSGRAAKELHGQTLASDGAPWLTGLSTGALAVHPCRPLACDLGGTVTLEVVRVVSRCKTCDVRRKA